MTDDRVKAAEFEVDRARGKFIATLQEISGQLQPHRLVEEVWEKAKDKGAGLAEDAVDAVTRRPVAAGAVVAGIVAFLAREPLMDLARGMMDGVSRRRKSTKRQKTKPTVQTEATK